MQPSVNVSPPVLGTPFWRCVCTVRINRVCFYLFKMASLQTHYCVSFNDCFLACDKSIFWHGQFLITTCKWDIVGVMLGRHCETLWDIVWCQEYIVRIQLRCHSPLFFTILCYYLPIAVNFFILVELKKWNDEMNDSQQTIYWTSFLKVISVN